jgi:hypothetical protein
MSLKAAMRKKGRKRGAGGRRKAGGVEGTVGPVAAHGGGISRKNREQGSKPKRARARRLIAGRDRPPNDKCFPLT